MQPNYACPQMQQVSGLHGDFHHFQWAEKDQDACRFLQKLLSEGTQEDIDKIFGEIIDN
ncbi:hypothetical protein ACJX0J_022093, partial [Zea mays]